MSKRQHAVNARPTGRALGKGVETGAQASNQRAPARASDHRLRTPAGDALSGVAIRVLRLAGLLTVVGDHLAAPAGQSSARWQVLAAADHAPATVAQIARTLGLARQSVQRIADLLAAEGLVVYADNPEHLRAKLVRLTAQGRSVLATIQKAQRGWADQLGGAIGETLLLRTQETLDLLLSALLAREGDDD